MKKSYVITGICVLIVVGVLTGCGIFKGTGAPPIPTPQEHLQLIKDQTEMINTQNELIIKQTVTIKNQTKFSDDLIKKMGEIATYAKGIEVSLIRIEAMTVLGKTNVLNDITL